MRHKNINHKIIRGFLLNLLWNEVSEDIQKDLIEVDKSIKDYGKLKDDMITFLGQIQNETQTNTKSFR